MDFMDQLISLPTRYLQRNITAIKNFILMVELFRYFLKEKISRSFYITLQNN